MTVHIVPRQGRVRRAPGPADLLTAGDGDTVLILGTPAPTDAATWSSAIGQAAMRGARIERRQP